MALVGVIAKALSVADIEGAAFGEIPADLGGGRSRGREQGGVPHRLFINPSKKYHERMKGGADVAAPPPEGQSVIPHPSSDPYSSPERLISLLGLDRENPGGKQGLLGAMNRQGGGNTFWSPGPGNKPEDSVSWQKLLGQPTADIPGTKIVQPHVREHTELPDVEQHGTEHDMPKIPGAHMQPWQVRSPRIPGISRFEGEPSNPFPPPKPRVGVIGGRGAETLHGGEAATSGRPVDKEPFADRPEGSGHRRS